MKALLRWLAKTIGGALTIVLVIVLFPYVSKVADRFLPDESGAAIKASMILATKLEDSARLETLRVTEDGVLNYDIQAAFLGTVGSINVSYTYEGSFGVDLSKVMIRISGNEITFLLPEPELIQDHLTANEVYRDDFWFPGFTDDDYEKLLEDERLARREVYLSGESEQRVWEATIAAFEKTVAAWMTEFNGRLTFQYVKANEDDKK